MRFTVRVPATSANLGPGFDSFGLALGIFNDVVVDTDAEPGVVWSGEGAAELPVDGTDMISRAMAYAAAEVGETLPHLSLRANNAIPLERGLGSSSAAAVAGITAALTVLGGEEDVEAEEVFDLAAAFEGHPDNAAPAVFGGLTVVVDGTMPVQLEPSDALQPVVLIPEGLRLPTDAARSALPKTVPFSDAVFNASHAAATVVALLTGDMDVLVEAMQDRIHEEVRLALAPGARRVYESVRDAGFPVCVSGAGPSLLAFERVGGKPVPDPGSEWRVLRPRPDLDGVRIGSLED